jgi:hypothetical protein
MMRSKTSNATRICLRKKLTMDQAMNCWHQAPFHKVGFVNNEQERRLLNSLLKMKNLSKRKKVSSSEALH